VKKLSIDDIKSNNKRVCARCGTFTCGWSTHAKTSQTCGAGRGEQMSEGGGNSQPTPPLTPPSCEMCNGVGFYVSLPGDEISPCPGCSEKDSTR